jgi:hypothetical protein
MSGETTDRMAFFEGRRNAGKTLIFKSHTTPVSDAQPGTASTAVGTWMTCMVLTMLLALGNTQAQTALDVSPSLPSSVPKEFSPMNWQPGCIGRVIINMPTDRPRSWSNEFDMAEVTRVQKPMSLTQFWSGVERIKTQFEQQKHRKHTSRLAYYEVIEDKAAMVVSFDDTSYWGPDLWRYVYLDKDHVYEFKTGALGTKGVKPSPELFKPFIEKYTPVLSRIHPRREGDIPSQAGLCIDGAVVSGGAGKNAVAALNVELAFGTELGIGYIENNHQVEMESGFEVLERDQKRADFALGFSNEPLGYKEFKVLRKQVRLLSGLFGQEFITRTRLNNGHVFYRFAFLIKGGVDSTMEPRISIHMDTPESPVNSKGKPYATLPPEDELIRVWDSVLRTFKVRPNALPDGQMIRSVN